MENRDEIDDYFQLYFLFDIHSGKGGRGLSGNDDSSMACESIRAEALTKQSAPHSARLACNFQFPRSVCQQVNIHALSDWLGSGHDCSLLEATWKEREVCGPGSQEIVCTDSKGERHSWLLQ